MRNKFFKRNKDRGSGSGGSGGSGGGGEDEEETGKGSDRTVPQEGDKSRHRSRRERHSSGNDVSPEVRAQVEADDRYYMHRMKAILEGYPTKGPPYEATRVSSHVWMGSQRNADDISHLQRLGITHVLNVAGTRRFDLKRSPYSPKDGIKGFLMIPAEDHDEYDIMRHFPDAIAFLDSCREQSGRAFVHCNLGINRSGTICAAYILASQHQNLLEVVQQLKKKRAVVLCNKNFRRQLVRFARARGLLDPYDPKLDPRTQLKEKGRDTQVDDKSFPTSLSAIREMVERPINGYQFKKKHHKLVDEYGVLAKGVKLRNLTDSKNGDERKAETLPRSYSAITTRQTSMVNGDVGLRKVSTAPEILGHKRSSSWSFSQSPAQPWSRPTTPTSFSRPLTLTASSEDLSNDLNSRLNLTNDSEGSASNGQRQYRRYTRSCSTPVVPSSMYSRPRPAVYREPRIRDEEREAEMSEVAGTSMPAEDNPSRRSYRRYTGSTTSPAVLAGGVPPTSYSHLYGDNDFAPGEISSVMAMREQMALFPPGRSKPHRSPLMGLLKGRRRTSEHSTIGRSSSGYF